MKRISHWIDGRTVESTSGRSSAVFDPATWLSFAAVAGLLWGVASDDQPLPRLAASSDLAP